MIKRSTSRDRGYSMHVARSLSQDLVRLRRERLATYCRNRSFKIDEVEDLFDFRFRTTEGFLRIEGSQYNQPPDGIYLELILTDLKWSCNFPKQFCGIQVRHNTTL